MEGERMMNANKLGLWCAAYGIDAPTNKIVTDNRVAMELAQLHGR